MDACWPNRFARSTIDLYSLTFVIGAGWWSIVASSQSPVYAVSLHRTSVVVFLHWRRLANSFLISQSPLSCIKTLRPLHDGFSVFCLDSLAKSSLSYRTSVVLPDCDDILSLLRSRERIVPLQRLLFQILVIKDVSKLIIFGSGPLLGVLLCFILDPIVIQHLSRLSR